MKEKRAPRKVQTYQGKASCLGGTKVKPRGGGKSGPRKWRKRGGFFLEMVSKKKKNVAKKKN